MAQLMAVNSRIEWFTEYGLFQVTPRNEGRKIHRSLVSAGQHCNNVQDTNRSPGVHESEITEKTRAHSDRARRLRPRMHSIRRQHEASNARWQRKCRRGTARPLHLDACGRFAQGHDLRLG